MDKLKAACVAALLAVAFVVTGCSAGAGASATDSVTPASTAPSATAEEKARKHEAEHKAQQAKLEAEKKQRAETALNNEYKIVWVRSKNRMVMYRDYEIAKRVIAKQLEKGTLGKPYRYNDMKIEWLPGQSGWGGISINTGARTVDSKPSAYAWVYFRANGSVDYSKGITSMSVDAGPKHRKVIIFDRFDAFGFEKLKLRYDVAMSTSPATGDAMRISCIDSNGYCESKDVTGQTTGPTELARLDSDATKELNRSMTALFGKHWRSLK